MRVALVHDWLVTQRGGERVLEELCTLFPKAELFTLIHKKGGVSPQIEERRIHTSFLQHVPGVTTRYRHLLPLFPAAIESFRLENFDLVLSSSHCVAKGIRPPPNAVHVSYVHAPMRYMWDLFGDYFGPGRAPLPVRIAARAARPALQRWDRRSSSRIDALIANSHNVAGKLGRFWGRSAHVVHPPVDLARFSTGPLGRGEGDYFLWLGAFAPYKRLDIAIDAFAALGLPLRIVGGGQEEARLSGRALPPNVKLLGAKSDAELPELYRRARAFIFTAEEDFGITPLEAQASGRPVIALGRGGALETVTPKTGLFFAEQTAESLADAVRRFERSAEAFDPASARSHAAAFSPERFRSELMRHIDAALTRGPTRGKAPPN